MKILVTGGAGYIGSTVCSALDDRGHTPVVLDSLVTGRREFTHERIFFQGDIGDGDVLAQVFERHPDIECAIHKGQLYLLQCRPITTLDQSG